jgi:hypothetical protein
MEFVTHLEQLASALTRQFGCEEMNLTVQMRRGEDWITVDIKTATGIFCNKECAKGTGCNHCGCNCGAN